MKNLNIEEEIRSGYKVSSKLKKIWNIELELLSELNSVCKKHNLTYYVMYGTLLGTIRHKGFIPWDDDMDVVMLREDFDKLCNVYNKEFSSPFFLQTYKTDPNYFIGMARLRNSNTTGIITYFNKLLYNSGIFIDIFVLDKLPENKILLDLYTFKARYLRFSLSNYNDIVSCRKFIAVKKFCLFLIRKKYSYSQLLTKYTKHCVKYNKSPKKYIGNIFIVDKDMVLFPLSDFKNSILMEYENTIVPVPCGYHHLLQICYGDYLKFPPLAERGMWHNGAIIFDPYVPYKQYFISHEDEFPEMAVKIKKSTEKITKK